MNSDVKVQQPAIGILQSADHGDAKAYKIACTCGNNDHTIDLWVEADEAGITVHQCVQVESNWWSVCHDGYPNRLVEFLAQAVYRVKTAWAILVKGYVKYESYTMMNEQQAINYSAALEQSVIDVKAYRAGKLAARAAKTAKAGQTEVFG